MFLLLSAYIGHSRPSVSLVSCIWVLTLPTLTITWKVNAQNHVTQPQIIIAIKNKTHKWVRGASVWFPAGVCQPLHHNKAKLLVYSWHAVCILLLWVPSLGKRCAPLLPQHMLNVIRHNGYAPAVLRYHTSLATMSVLTVSRNRTTIVRVSGSCDTLPPSPRYYCTLHPSTPLSTSGGLPTI